MQVDEEQVNRWANPPSETENEKCENAVSQISEALRSYFGNKIYFIRQGSHRNRTNVRLDSDIDLAVVHKDYHFPYIGFLSDADRQLYNANFVKADYPFSQFKNDVHEVMKKKFGDTLVTRENKCLKVSGNSYRVNADVVPAYEHSRYSSYGVISDKGIELVADKTTSRVYSFPEQHYENGVKKNDNTGRSYKSVVRILKNIRNRFVDEGSLDIKTMPSYFIESLVWNVPDSYFQGSTWRDDAESAALKIWDDMQNPEIANNYLEVSRLIWLFRGQNRVPKQAEDFMLRAWALIKK